LSAESLDLIITKISNFIVMEKVLQYILGVIYVWGEIC
jgi:hypothetical protein